MSEHPFYANRITALQRLRGITQQQMAGELDVSGAYLSQVRSGKRPMSSDLAHRASAVYKVPLSYFAAPAIATDAAPVTFRKKASAKVRDEAQVVETYNEALRVFRHASEASGYHVARLPGVSPDIEAMATAVRKSAGVGANAPIKNMTRLCERLGVGVVTDLDPLRSEVAGDHTGLSRPAETERPLIAVLGADRGDVRRFTIAHELCHLIADQDLSTSLTSTRDDREQRAHAFAGALLIPEAVARKHLSESLTLHGFLRVKADYGISVGALIMRARQLGLVSDQRRRSLFIQMSSMGWRKHQGEPVPVAFEKPLLLDQALRRAHGSNYVAKVSHLLGTPVDLLQHWTQGDVADEARDNEATIVQLRPR